MTTTMAENGHGTPQDATKRLGDTQTTPETTESVESVTALDGVRNFITRFVALSDAQADAITLWVAHAHAFDASETTPYMRVTSVGPSCGKTLLLEVCEALVPAPVLTSRLTGPALARLVDQDKPTLLLDETDSTFVGNSGSQNTLRGILNSGYKRSGKVIYAQGQGVKVCMTFCPKMLAGIGDLPSTVMSRSVTIAMRKRSVFEKVESFRERTGRNEAMIPRTVVKRFALANIATLMNARPEIPRELDDRAADVWEPLLAIADLVGGTWPERARLAAVELSADRHNDNTGEDLSFRLLAAISDIFADLKVQRLKSVTIIETLQDNPEWLTVDGSPLTPRLLSDMLRGFGVGPRKLRFGKAVAMGYESGQIADAWKMVAPSVPDVVDVDDV